MPVALEEAPSSSVARIRPFSPVTFGFWRAYWVTCRPYLFFVSGTAGLIGLSIAPHLSRLEFIAAFVAFFLTYGLGQALTDVFQTDTDSISSPYRPLIRGIVTRRSVFVVSLIGLMSCGAVFFLLNAWTILFSTLGILGLGTYTYFKRRWWAGPAWNSGVVALLPIIGLLCGEENVRTALSTPILWALMASAFFSYAIFVVLGYFKDVSADRTTGYNTLLVRFGWRPSVLISAGLLPATIAASAWAIQQSGFLQRTLDVRDGGAILFWIGGVVVLLFAHGALWRIQEEKQSHGAIVGSVRGFIMLHISEAVAFQPILFWPAILYYGLFELTIALRPEKTQI